MLGSGKSHVGGTGVGGDGTGAAGGLGGGLNTEPDPSTTGADDDVPDACGEPPPVEVPPGVGPLGIADPLEEGDAGTADVPVEASAPDWAVVIGGATAPPQPAEAKAKVTDATQRDRDRRRFMSTIEARTVQSARQAISRTCARTRVPVWATS
jgi:hypothetical protein